MLNKIFIMGRLTRDPELRRTQSGRHQLEYVCDLLCPFYAMTAFILEMRGPSVHKMFDVYESLFKHLEKAIETLQHKQIF